MDHNSKINNEIQSGTQYGETNPLRSTQSYTIILEFYVKTLRANFSFN